AELAKTHPDYADLAGLGQQLFPAGRPLYKHQWSSLHEAVTLSKDIVVTTGTGSGKTECFLLPLLAQLACESKQWTAPSAPASDRLWWKDGQSGNRVAQWEHVTRPAAMRALILYPLNALVEDQLRRLRSALDSDPVHHWLNTYRNTNRITFGRYTGATPL